MKDTVRGLIVFAAVLITIGFWAPLREQAEARLDGGTSNDIYFGLFRYMTLHTEMKEPDYQITKIVSPSRATVTGLATVGLWTGILIFLKKTRPSRANSSEA